MTSATLVVWLCGRAVADLVMGRKSVPELCYRHDYVAEKGEGALGLSIPLPVAARRYRGDSVAWWMEGLLPEGETRTSLERFFRVRRGDSFALLAALGRDCAGAVAFTSPGEDPATDSETTELTTDQVLTAIESLPQNPLGVNEQVRVSLGGLQSKLLLVRTDHGWARPTGAAPSTHILKPDSVEFPGLVVAEALAQRAGRLAGLDAASVELTDFGGRPVLVVERFDREVKDNVFVRLHQEDGCQALSLNPARDKYQGLGGRASYAAFAKVLLAYSLDRQRELQKLGEMMTFTIAVGNTDAHLRNHALLHGSGVVSLAPIYDAAPTSQFVSTREVALWVANQPLLIAITRKHLVDEMVGWGLKRIDAESVVESTLAALADALPCAAAQLPSVPATVVEYCLGRTQRLLSG